MNYELAKQLKDSGFPFDWCADEMPCLTGHESEGIDCFPTLSELIGACGNGFYALQRNSDTKEYYVLMSSDEWQKRKLEKIPFTILFTAKTPEEAVANLWLELNKK